MDQSLNFGIEGKPLPAISLSVLILLQVRRDPGPHVRNHTGKGASVTRCEATSIFAAAQNSKSLLVGTRN
jgi:hypothetical protein